MSTAEARPPEARPPGARPPAVSERPERADIEPVVPAPAQGNGPRRMVVTNWPMWVIGFTLFIDGMDQLSLIHI